MNKFKFSLSVGLFLTFQMVFAQGFPKNCIDEILALPSKNSNFDVQKFLTDLPIEVVKTKAKLKLPFGKPKDTEITSVGITVGCAKVFPESPAQVAATVKDIGMELAKKLGVKAVGAGVNALTGGAAGGAVADAPAGSQQTAKAAAATPVAAGPVLKKCDFVFNPEKRFCYDGAAYDKCDGMEYNPTTHICSNDVANRALCNNIQYNPITQRCEGGAIEFKCGNDWFNPLTHFCYSENKIVIKCGANPQIYNPDLFECKPNINANGIFLKTPIQHSGENYEAVLIGEQIWLARNLNKNISGSVCYNDSDSSCAAYGRLYDLETARTACPAGWYLPSNAEWKTLTDYAGGMSAAGKKLKAENFGGTNNYGFTALPNGFGFSDKYSSLGEAGYWWSSAESGADARGVTGAYAWYIMRESNFSGTFNKNNLFGVRCLRYVDASKRKSSFFVNITTKPAGAALKFNGASTNSCPATPCKVELKEGKYNINFALNFYDPIDTAIILTGDRYIDVKLEPNFGVLDIKEFDYLGDVGANEQWNLDDKPFSFGELKLSPGKKIVKLTHNCYNDIVDSVTIRKGGRLELDVSKKVALKQSKVVLNATYKGRVAEDPIFVDRNEFGKTPFNGSVPLCSEIAITEPDNRIGVKLSENSITEYTHKKSIFLSTFLGTAFNVAGAIFLINGFFANEDVTDYYERYSELGLHDRQGNFNDLWDKQEQRKSDRNIYYIIGSVLMASGIGVYIWF